MEEYAKYIASKNVIYSLKKYLQGKTSVYILKLIAKK